MQKSKKQNPPHRKLMTGKVVSDKMNKTIVVRVGRTTLHPVFGKTVRRFNKFKAHDAKNAAKTGDTVKIMETRPLSKDKRWRLVEILKKQTA
ncbi:MAG: 30S ribosomal protein S17 [Candidatus Omnitrophica bacterium]|nr:30S ribosomal protein S17 [Candidatus Omnitrophota bacterium]